MEQLFGEAELIEFEAITIRSGDSLSLGSISLLVDLIFCVIEPIQFKGKKFTVKHFIKKDKCMHSRYSYCSNNEYIESARKYIENDLGLDIGSKVKISCPYISEDVFFSQKDFLVIEDLFLLKELNNRRI